MQFTLIYNLIEKYFKKYFFSKTATSNNDIVEQESVDIEESETSDEDVLDGKEDDSEDALYLSDFLKTVKSLCVGFI